MKPILELSFRQAAQQDEILGESRELFYQKVVPVMEELMDASSGEEVLRRFDRIEIDLGVIHGRDWKNTFTEQLKEALKEKLKGELPGSSVKDTDVIHRTDLKLKALFFYLEKGFLPWWSPGEDPPELLTFCLDRHSEKMKEYFTGSGKEWKTCKRLVSTLREKDLEEVIRLVTAVDTLPVPYRAILSVRTADLREILKRTFIHRLLYEGGFRLEQDPGSILEQVVSASIQDNPDILSLFEIAMKRKELPVTMRTVVERIISKDSKDEIHGEEVVESRGETESDEEPRDIETEEIYINHAGLVLLYPFLEELFNRFDLLDGKEFRNPFSREQGAWLVSFLMNDDGQGEENMVMNKILCGMEPSDPLFYPFVAADDAREACHELLRKALSEWPSMEGTSPDALRETWLSREGKIVAGHGRWSLKVERKTVDILLEKVPWPLSVIKLPWMEKILYVEW